MTAVGELLKNMTITWSLRPAEPSRKIHYERYGHQHQATHHRISTITVSINYCGSSENSLALLVLTCSYTACECNVAGRINRRTKVN